MEELLVTKRSIFLAFCLAIIILTILFFTSFFDKKARIVFCDVGQGDAAYVRLKNQFDILIDTGPNQKILECLGRNMPFYDKKIELVIISHPQLDHYGGLRYLIDRYQINRIYLNDMPKNSSTLNNLKQKIYHKKIPVLPIWAGSQIKLDNAYLNFFWPPKKLLEAQSSPDENFFSIIFSLNLGKNSILFTGDASSNSLNRLLRSDIKNISILKIPHHGSKNGLTRQFLKLADPQVAVISVGKNNPYGHPAKQVLEMLEALKIKIKRTDEDGDIVFKL